jgi:hypothetical protein
MDKRVVAVGIGLLVVGTALIAVPLQTEQITGSNISNGGSLNFTVPSRSEILPTPLYLNLSWGQDCMGGAEFHYICGLYNFTLLDCGQLMAAAIAACHEVAVSATAQTGSLDVPVTAGHFYSIVANASYPAFGSTHLTVVLTTPSLGGRLGVGILALGVGALVFGIRRKFPGRAGPPPPF